MAGSGINLLDLDVFKDIMRISTLRGTDGTGIFQGRFGKYSQNTYILEKKSWEVNSYFRYHKSSVGNKLLLNSTADNVFIGHTRWATMGSVDDSSCHPFKVNDLVGVHNGTMDDMKYHHKTKTDSELLYEDIDRRGLKEVLETADGNSAYALSMFDMNTYTLHFARNIQRPLWVAFHKDRRVMYWASEPEFIKCATGRKNVTICDPMYFDTSTIYSIKLEDIDKHKSCKFQTESFRSRPTHTVKKKTEVYKQNYDMIEWSNNNSNYPGMDTDEDDHVPFDNGVKKITLPPVGIRTSPKLTKAERKEQRRKAREAMLTEASARATAAQIVKAVNSFAPKLTIVPKVTPELTKRMTQCSKIPTYSCTTCGRELKLIDQYFAQKDPVGKTDKMFECKECVDLNKQISEHSRSDAIETRH